MNQESPCGDRSEPGLYDPVSGVRSCCIGTHKCGANNICQFDAEAAAEVAKNKSLSGYYVGSCTDPTLQSPMCRGDCRRVGPRGDIEGDLVFVRDGLWACCGRNPAGEVDCSTPLLSQSFELGWSPEQFPGPINAIYTPAGSTTIAPTMTSGTGSATIPTATMDASPSSEPTEASSGSITTGAKAGIGVGVSLGVVSFIAIIVFLILRRRRQRAWSAESPSDMLEIDQDPKTIGVVEVKHNESLLNERSAEELDGTPRRHELEAEVDSRIPWTRR